MGCSHKNAGKMAKCWDVPYDCGRVDTYVIVLYIHLYFNLQGIDRSRSPSHAVRAAHSPRQRVLPPTAQKSAATIPGSPRLTSPSSPCHTRTPDGASRAGFRPVSPSMNMQGRVPPRGAESAPTSFTPVVVPHIGQLVICTMLL